MGDHIIRRREALQRGATDHELQRQCRTGTWKRLRPGTFAVSVEHNALDAIAQHRLVAEAALRAAAPDSVLSHQSAAAVHGFEMWNVPLRVVHLTRNRKTGGRRTQHRHVHSAVMAEHEIIEVDGLRVTTPARTMLDLSRSLNFEEALATGDHAVRAGLVTTADLDAAAAAMPEHSGRRRARRVFRFLDGRAESVGESRSRALFIRKQLPVPEPQANLFSATGDHLGRVDFLLEALGVVGEFDGRIKYGRLVPEGQVPADVLWAEKLREDAIRSAGWQVVRWIWDELATPHVIVGRIQDAVERARLCPPPQGWVDHTPRP
ncbi:hypothetical protein [Rhodococcus sp. NPDC058514]|uniref:type IV toxin-antitoxin system AbiEi family antitoxin domain-containing protein n=2 Tax=unclassified Rhodococcus (in: high G+C Gram-positive bacteria) TaxID=192944 RepID=UPI00366498F7